MLCVVLPMHAIFVADAVVSIVVLIKSQSVDQPGTLPDDGDDADSGVVAVEDDPFMPSFFCLRYASASRTHPAISTSAVASSRRNGCC